MQLTELNGRTFLPFTHERDAFQRRHHCSHPHATAHDQKVLEASELYVGPHRALKGALNASLHAARQLTRLGILEKLLHVQTPSQIQTKKLEIHYEWVV